MKVTTKADVQIFVPDSEVLAQIQAISDALDAQCAGLSGDVLERRQTAQVLALGTLAMHRILEHPVKVRIDYATAWNHAAQLLRQR